MDGRKYQHTCDTHKEARIINGQDKFPWNHGFIRFLFDVNNNFYRIVK